MKRAFLCALAVVAAPLVSGAAPAHKTHAIVIDNMKFGPAPAGLRVGDSILWINRDMFRHTATARDKSFNIDLAPGKSGKTVLKHAGMIAYSCTFHPGMKGVLKVRR